eukprot:g2062.t1
MVSRCSIKTFVSFTGFLELHMDLVLIMLRLQLLVQVPAAQPYQVYSPCLNQNHIRTHSINLPVATKGTSESQSPQQATDQPKGRRVERWQKESRRARRSHSRRK